MLESITMIGAAPDEDWLKFLLIGGGMLIGLTAVVFTFTRSILVARSREHSRREIAAYVAEGSMSAEDGSRLLNAGRPAWERGEGAWRGAWGSCGRKA